MSFATAARLLGAGHLGGVAGEQAVLVWSVSLGAGEPTGV